MGKTHNFVFCVVSGKKFVLSMPPHVAFTSDLESDKRFIQNDFGNQTLLADFGDSGTVVLPDFTNPSTENWFSEQLKTFLVSLDKSPPGIFNIA